MTKPAGLVPLDGSATAESVLPWAATMANALGLRLVLLDLVTGAVPGDERSGTPIRPAREYLTGVAQRLTEQGLEVETMTRPAGDDIAAGIVGVADELRVAIIMIATHGHSGVRRMMMGSVADAVVRSAHRPVLVVHGGKNGGTPSGAVNVRRILLPLDGSAPSEEAMAQAVAVARACHAAVDLVQVVPWSWTVFASAPEVYLPEGIDEQLEAGAVEYLEGVKVKLPADVSTRVLTLRGDAASQLIDYAHAEGIDLVVMSTHGRSGVARWALGSVADKILRGGGLPVLLVRATSVSAEPQAPAPH